MTDSFYVHLPSNVDGTGSAWNTPSRYTTYLIDPIELEVDEWEVALDEVIIPLYRDTPAAMTEYADPRHKNHIWIRSHTRPDAATLKKIIIQYDMFSCMVIPDAERLKTWPAVMQAIADLEFNGRKIMNYDGSTLKSMNTNALDVPFDVYIYRDLAVDMGLLPNEDTVSLSYVFYYPGIRAGKPLWLNLNLLGPFPRNLVNPTSPGDAKFNSKTPRLRPSDGLFRHRHFSAIFVNTDLVETHPVGNVKTDAIRVIDVHPVQRGVYERYTNPQFYPLRTATFRKITIYLTDEQARQIELDAGLTIATLLFRRKR